MSFEEKDNFVCYTKVENDIIKFCKENDISLFLIGGVGPYARNSASHDSFFRLRHSLIPEMGKRKYARLNRKWIEMFQNFKSIDLIDYSRNRGSIMKATVHKKNSELKRVPEFVNIFEATKANKKKKRTKKKSNIAR